MPGTICASPGVAFTEDQLAKMLAVPLPLLLTARTKMREAGMISLSGGLIQVCNWEHYQVDYSRVEKYRQKRELESNQGESSWGGRREGAGRKRQLQSSVTASGETVSTEETRRRREEEEKNSSRCLSADINFGDFCKLYEGEIGPITGMIGDRLKELSDEYPVRWFEEAVKIAGANGKRKLAYVEGVLKNYRADGFEVEETEEPNGQDAIARLRAAHPDAFTRGD